MKKVNLPRKESKIKQALLGLYGIVGVSLSTFGGFKVPFAESHAKEYWRHAVAGIFLVLAIIAGIVSFALYVFDANYFKSQIVAYVKTHNQRDLTLEGDLKVTFFPKLGLDAGKMTVSQQNSSKVFASIADAHFYIAWWPMLLKNLQIESVALDGVHANVIRYKNGSTNFDDLLDIGGNIGQVKFEINSVKIINSSGNYQDEPSGLTFSLHDLNMETGKLTDSSPGEITANFRLESPEPHIDSKVKLSSHLLFELKAGHYEFANFEGQMEGVAAGISNLALTFQGTLNAYPAAERWTIDKFIANAKGKIENRKLDAKLDLAKLKLDKNTLSGSTLVFNATLLQDEENLSTSLELPAFEMTDKKLMSDNIFINFDLFKTGRTLQGKLNSPLNVDFKAMQLQLPNITSKLNGTHPVVSSKLTAAITGNMQAKLSDQNIALELKAKIDDSNFVGLFTLQDFTHPALTVDLDVNTLDLDRYLVADWAKRLQDDVLPFDLSGLKELNLRGKLRCNECKFAKLKTSNVAIDIHAKQAILLIEPISAKLYGGTTQGSFSISAHETPTISFKQRLNNVQLNDMFSDLMPGDAKLTGKGNLAFDLNATLVNMASLRKTLSGNASLALAHGSLAGINMEDTLLLDTARLLEKEGEHSLAAKFTETTAFSELKSTFNINEGKVHSSDFLLKTPLFTSKGEGDFDIESGKLNYQLNTTMASNLKRSSNGEIAELKGITLPMRIIGPYATPTITLDFATASGGSKPKPLKEVVTEAAKPVPTKNKTSAK